MRDTVENLQQAHEQIYEDVVYAAKLWSKDIYRAIFGEIEYETGFRTYFSKEDALMWEKLTGEWKDGVRVCEECLEALDRSAQAIILDTLMAAVEAGWTAIWTRDWEGGLEYNDLP